MSYKGTVLDESKTEVITQFPVPQTVRDIKVSLASLLSTEDLSRILLNQFPTGPRSAKQLLKRPKVHW